MTLNPQSAVSATLSHHGSTIISRDALKNLQTPEPTSSHIPVAHSLLMDCVEASLNRQGMKIESEQYSVAANSNKLFGVLKVSGRDQNEYRMALGIRAANDKSMPVSMVAGANVFVCDNMMMRGDLITLRRRHTSNLNIQQEVQDGVSRAIEGYQSIGSLIDTWKGIELSDIEAKALILDAAVKEVMPLHLIPQVLEQWIKPKHDDFRERTLWSLHNGFTESFKLLKPHVAMESATDLARFLQDWEKKGKWV